MFSVIIPLYNKELQIKNTIDSVLKQNLQNFEIIVIDDGSTDNSAQIVKNLKDKRIHLIQQKNQGVSAARNRGIYEANYNWIAFLDGDDLWNKDHLEEITIMIQKYPKEKIFSTSFKYSDLRPIYKQQRSEKIFKIDNYFKEAMHETPICTGAIVIKKNHLLKVGGFNEKISRGEDLDLWARLAKDNSIIKSTKITMTYSTDNPKSLSKGKSEYEKSILSIISLVGTRAYERKYYKKMIIRRLIMNIKSMDILEAIKIIKKHNIQLLF